MYPNTGYDPNAAQWAAQSTEPDRTAADLDEGDNSHRPPNAFILYSQAMRSEARQQNPSLSNTEVSRILGKMWKEVPNEIKLQYKQKAAKLQEEFKKTHPDYTYRKARRKRALNELLTKSTQGYTGMQFISGNPMDQMQFMQMMQQSQNMGGAGFQMGAAGQMGAGQMGAAQMGQQGQQPMMQGYPGMQMMGGMPGATPGMPGMDQQMPQMQMYGQMGQFPGK
ncbi:HMG box family protein [Tritrichomonas foetus]|uniref:HMG box family protein n=1 Tax=Tritrichomonas foetus TaxID=1144522 RepID=A0A1J4KZX2_9EUKA|nr:HMG box family protein [Tritrichomonas foetus]|eukprot:OHT16416.1 HMG box family protein [Tritrichomonas foetus]